jgi:hypothetical protein
VLAIPGLISLQKTATFAVCILEVVILLSILLALPGERGNLSQSKAIAIGVTVLFAGSLPFLARQFFPAANPYEQATYNAYEFGGLKPTLQATRVRGDCWESSIADATREDAFRCVMSDQIHLLDPCFTGSLGESIVVCAEDPWTPAVRVMTLTRPLPNPSPLRGLPWAVELESGERCILETGASATLAGERLNYECDLYGARLYALDLKAGRARLERPDGTDVRDVPIARVWS